MNFAPQPKGRTKRQLKGRKARHEAAVIAVVRAVCVERDGYCRIRKSGPTLAIVVEVFGACDGPSQWCHMHQKRRSRTVGQAPEVRHTTADSFMACVRHHADYDAYRLLITSLTRAGADGPLRFTRSKS